MRTPALVAVFAAYTASSSGGLLLLRAGLPKARGAFEQGALISSASLMAVFGTLAYAASFVLWLFIVAQVPVARAYPVCVGLTLAFTALGAHFAIGEKVSLLNLMGIIAVFIGVVLISASATEPA